MNPVTLAFVGDAVYTLYVREKITLSADYHLGVMQKMTSDKVSAHGQNITLREISPMFTQDEADIFRRARNAKKATKSKNADVAEYNNSTGFEAVLGYLYLTGRYDRISELLNDDADKGQ